MSQQTNFVKVTADNEWPLWGQRNLLVSFLHKTMKPYEDSPADINRALDKMLSDETGFAMLMEQGGKLVGALVMLDTGMSGYIPEHILLFVSVSPALRGQGLGRVLVEKSLAECNGQVKLHVEYDNPAKRLYERIGFTTKYAEMRYNQ